MTDEKKTILTKLRKLGFNAVTTECDWYMSREDRWCASARRQTYRALEAFARCEIDALRKLLSDALRKLLSDARQEAAP